METTETEIYLPFQLKGAENLKDVCKFGILISNQKEIEEKITGSNIGNYAVGKSSPISEMLGKTNSRFKTSKEDLINTLNKMGIGSSGTKYYWIYLEYKGRYYISDECGIFYLEESSEDVMRKYLIQLYHDTDGDNWNKNENWCSDKPLEDWWGVTCYNGLYRVSLSGNNLKGNIDLQGCAGLYRLACDRNEIETINLQNCANLNSLFADYNDFLCSVDVSNCSKLSSFSCSWAPELLSVKALNCISLTNFNLSKLDVPVFMSINLNGCNSLTNIRVVNAGVQTLNLDGTTNLKELYCYGNELRTLDLSSCGQLTRLDCQGNKLLSLLNLSSCTELERLSCSDNELTDLDVQNCKKLTHLYCNNNKICKQVPDSFRELKEFYGDSRYWYSWPNEVLTWEDLGVGWWYPGEPESGVHGWPD